MTEVHVDLRVPAEDGEDAPAVGHLECAPSKRRTADEHVILPKPFRVELEDGQTLLDLAPTGIDWCWVITELTKNGKRRFVIVPDTERVEYEDLVDVDPATLDPTAEPEAAWWIKVEDIEAGQIDPAVVEAAVDTALEDRLSSGGSTHLGEGPPPALIVGAKVGDIYIDTLTGTLYQLGA